MVRQHFDEVFPMTVAQLKFNLNEIASAQTHSERALLCRNLLEASAQHERLRALCC